MSEDPTSPQSSSEAEHPEVLQASSTHELAPAEDSDISKPAEPVQAAAAPEMSRSPDPIPVAVEASGTKQTLDKILKWAQETWVKVQPVLKEKGTQALLVANRFTNDFLDNTGPKLANQAITKIPDSAKAKVAQQQAKLQPTLEKLQPIWDKAIVPLWQKVVVPYWNKGLVLLKQRLPENLQVLTHRFLTVAIITTTVLIYWFFSSLTAGKPAVAKPPPVPTKPVLTRSAPRPVAQRPTTVQPMKPSVAAPKPPIAVTPPRTVVAKPVVPSPKTVAPAAAPTLAAAPKPVSSPALDLTEIQTQMAGAVAGLGDDLVTSVKAGDANRQLRVSLGTHWDTLSAADQQAVAQKLWGRSQKLAFKTFELFDSSNTLVARSPVVGTNVILFLKPALDEPN